MKIEFEVRDDFAKDGWPLYGELIMASVMPTFGNFGYPKFKVEKPDGNKIF